MHVICVLVAVATMRQDDKSGVQLRCQNAGSCAQAEG
jgi:hypothetical protein